MSGFTAMNSQGKRVLLLRTPAEDTPDRYEAEFGARGYVPWSVPVLETVLKNVGTLREIIERGPWAGGRGEEGGRVQVDGVVMTSKRSVEAWWEGVKLISEDRGRDGDREADWRGVPFYVVGEATAGAARKIREWFSGLGRVVPVDVRGGAQAGTAERLAHFILEDLGGDGRKLLYLTGDKNRETLPQILEKGNVGLDALEVYRTTGSSTFGADLRDTLEKAGGEMDEEWGWVVYFAPSAAAFVTPFLLSAFRLRDQCDEELEDGALMGKPTLKVAAIGHTTASFLRDTLKLQVDVVAPKPSPDALVNAIIAFDSA